MIGSPEAALPATLLVFARPALERSRVNRTLWSATEGLPDRTRHVLQDDRRRWVSESHGAQAVPASRAA